MPSQSRVACALSLLALCLAPALMAQPEQQPPPEGFGEETSVVVVEVPVQVVRDGKPVRGLTAEDFAVYDGRTERPIASFEVVDLAASAAPGAAPAQPPSLAARRHFLLLFDLYFTSTKSLLASERAARQLLAEGLHPTDLVGVGFFSDVRGVIVPVPFTADRARVAGALDAFHELLDRKPPKRGAAAAAAAAVAAGDGAAAAPDPAARLGLTARDLASFAGRIGSGKGDKGNPFMELLMDGYYTEGIVEWMNQNTTTNREVGRGELEMFARSMETLARAMADVDGGKHLVFFSDGFSGQYLRGQRTPRPSGFAGGGGDAAFADAAAWGDLNRMTEEFRRSGWVVHTVEAVGLVAEFDQFGEFNWGGIGSTGLNFMAKETGGNYFHRMNDLSAALERMLETSTVTYVLTFQVPEIKFDGAYHKLDVKLRGGRDGARIVHRAGYYAPRRELEDRQLRKARAIDLLMGPERSDLVATALATPFRGPDGGGYVPVVVEVDASSLAPEVKDPTTALEFYGYAFDVAGEVADFFTQTVRFETARYGEMVRSGGIRFVADLELPAGRYDLRLLVRGPASGRAAVRVLALEVPDFTRLPARLLPPFFVQPERAGLTVREAAGDPEALARAYPFVAGGRMFVPAAQPVVRQGEEVRLFLAGYNLSYGNVEVEGRVLGRDGKAVGRAAVKPLGRDVNAAGLDHLLATFRAGRLKPGDYVLEVSVIEPDPLGLSISLSDADRGHAIRASAPFRVVAKR
jgi:VWFA-related protein